MLHWWQRQRQKKTASGGIWILEQSSQVGDDKKPQTKIIVGLWKRATNNKGVNKRTTKQWEIMNNDPLPKQAIDGGLSNV